MAPGGASQTARTAHAQPGTLYADIATLEAWRARGGHPPTVIYASGERLDPAQPCAALVRQWIDAGLVIAHQVRGADGVMRHLVRLAGEPLPAPAAELVELSPRDRRVLQVLRDFAGDPLPSNKVIALAAGLGPRPEVANYRMKKLEKAGLIRRELLARPDGPALRFAIICGGV
jgi:hypothetical protein